MARTSVVAVALLFVVLHVRLCEGTNEVDQKKLIVFLKLELFRIRDTVVSLIAPAWILDFVSARSANVSA